MDYNNTRNPILPVEIHIPDSEAHVMPDGRLYIYGSYEDGKAIYCSEEYHVVSTSDMVNWTFHDKSFDGKDVPWCNNPAYPHYPGIDWSKPTPFLKKMLDDAAKAEAAKKEAFARMTEEERRAEEEKQRAEEEKRRMAEKEAPQRPLSLLYAPDCIYKNGKYYLYFCTSDDQEGVAVSDRPEGPFANPVQIHVGGIDPAIFVDDDGSAYYYWGQIFAHGVKLNDDMCTFNKDDIVDNLVTEKEHYFHEGSSMRKIRGKYYMVYSDMERGKPNSIGYSMGDSPLGPFTYKGIIVSSDECDPMSWNNHGSIECVNGEYYVFYHRSTRNSQGYRRLCIEKIHLNDDGTIDEVKMTSQGIGEPFAEGETIYGYMACGVFGGAYIDACDEKDCPGEWLVAEKDGCSAIFRYVESEKGFKTSEIYAKGTAKLTVALDDEEVGTCDITSATPMRITLNLKKTGPGTKTLRVIARKPENFRLISIVLH